VLRTPQEQCGGRRCAHEHAPRHVVSKLPYRPAVRELGSKAASGAAVSLRTWTRRDWERLCVQAVGLDGARLEAPTTVDRNHRAKPDAASSQRR